MNNIVSRETFCLTLSSEMEEEGISHTPSFLEKSFIFYEALMAWNKTHKLTANTHFQNFIKKQVVDSLLFLKLSPDTSGKKNIDIGSGGGFPGIPLALMLPDTLFTITDLIRKKTSFLSYAKALLELTNCSVVTGDALLIDETFDYLFLKAVSREELFLEKASRRLSNNGKIVLYHAPRFKPTLPPTLSIEKSLVNSSNSSAISLIALT